MSQEEISNFSQLIAVLAEGEVNNQFTDAYRELIAEMNQKAMDHGGVQKGSISLSLNLTFKNGVFEVLVSEPKVSKPKAPPIGSVLWGTGSNKLALSDPKQGKLELHPVHEEERETINI